MEPIKTKSITQDEADKLQKRVGTMQDLKLKNTVDSLQKLGNEDIVMEAHLGQRVFALLQFHQDILCTILCFIAKNSIQDLMAIKGTCKQMRKLCDSKFVFQNIPIFDYLPPTKWLYVDGKMSHRFHVLIQECYKKSHLDAEFIITIMYHLRNHDKAIQMLGDLAKRGHNLSAYTCGMLYICQGKPCEGLLMFDIMWKRDVKTKDVRVYEMHVKKLLELYWQALSSDLVRFICNNSGRYICDMEGNLVRNESGAYVLKNGWPLSEKEEDEVVCPMCKADLICTSYFS